MTVGSYYYYHYWSTKQHQYFYVAGVGLTWYSQIDNHNNLQPYKTTDGSPDNNYMQ